MGAKTLVNNCTGSRGREINCFCDCVWQLMDRSIILLVTKIIHDKYSNGEYLVSTGVHQSSMLVGTVVVAAAQINLNRCRKLVVAGFLQQSVVTLYE